MNSYAKRSINLKSIGFADYGAYLHSKLWLKLRRRVLGRNDGVCEVCGKARSRQVHHRNYDVPVLLGRDLRMLVACCAACHQNAEFADGRKTTLPHANARLKTAALANGNHLNGICVRCKRNSSRRGRNMCRPCLRAVGVYR